MRIMIAPDSFKESLSAKEVALALKSGLEKALPDADFDLMLIQVMDLSPMLVMGRLPFLKWLRFVAWSRYLRINATPFV